MYFSFMYDEQVFDEADMLLCGSFQNQVIRLINMLRFEEKSLSKFNKSEVENSEKSNSDPSMDLEADCGEDLKSPQDLDEESLSGPSDEDGDFDNRPTREKDWRRVRKIYARSKQYIFVAATLPESGKRTAGGILKRMFPESRWVSGSYLHCQNPRCSTSPPSFNLIKKVINLLVAKSFYEPH